MATQPIYQLYAELLDYNPAIWRRFQLPANLALSRLGYTLMTLYEMKGGHLFQFILPEAYNISLYRVSLGLEPLPDEEQKKMILYEMQMENMLDSMFPEDEDSRDMAAAKLKDVFKGIKGEKLLFEYDFGDSWTVEVTLEAVMKDPDLPGKDLPRVLEGAGFGIIEDCGGTPGLMDVAKAFKKKRGSAYREYQELLGVDDLDLSSFDMEDMNVRLKRIPRMFHDLYENRKPLSRRSIDFLERKYRRPKEPR